MPEPPERWRASIIAVWKLRDSGAGQADRRGEQDRGHAFARVEPKAAAELAKRQEWESVAREMLQARQQQGIARE